MYVSTIKKIRRNKRNTLNNMRLNTKHAQVHRNECN